MGWRYNTGFFLLTFGYRTAFLRQGPVYCAPAWRNPGNLLRGFFPFLLLAPLPGGWATGVPVFPVFFAGISSAWDVWSSVEASPFWLDGVLPAPRPLCWDSSSESSLSPSPFWLLRPLPLPSELFPSPLFPPLPWFSPSPLFSPPPLFSPSPLFPLLPLFPPSPLEEGLSSPFPPPCLPGGECPGSSGSRWGNGSVSPLVEFYALELAAVWLPLAASVALVVAGALVVELVGVVAAVVALVQVATVSPLRQPGLDLFPKASVLPQVSMVVFRLLRSLYHPVLGLALVHSTQLPFNFSSPSWASSAWGLSWVLGRRPHGSTFSPIRLGCWALLRSCP